MGIITRTILFIILSSLSISIFAREITDYKCFAELINHGQTFKIITHFNECTVNGVKSNSNVISYSTPTSILVLSDKQHIATSTLHFSNAKGIPIYEYVKYTFSPDNKAVIQITSFNPQTFVALNPVKTYECTLGQAIFIYN